MESESHLPPNSLDLRSGGKCLGTPSLPEPTEPPPPPPELSAYTLSPAATSEPIYESVLPRDEGGDGERVDMSPPPLPAPPHKLQPKSPGVDRIQKVGDHRPTSPIGGSPRNSRPSSRASSAAGVRADLSY